MMKIRKMVMADYPFVKTLWHDCGLSDEPEDEKEEMRAFLETSHGAGFVAKENGSIVGAALCGSDGRYGYIHHLAVMEEKRHRGVGRSLAEACIRFLKKRHVIIMVRKENNTGNAFWKHLQFEDADWVKVQFIKTR